MATPVYNAERWIYPFLKLTPGLDRQVLVLGENPTAWVQKEYGLSSELDRTERIVRKHFPEVEIIKQRSNVRDANFWNQGHEYLASDCDFIFRFDSDEMMMPYHWNLLLDRVKSNDEKSISIDFGKNGVLFHHPNDLVHGVMHPEDSFIETRGLRSELRYDGFGAFDLSTSFLFSPPRYMIYHYQGWKGGEKSKELRNDWFPTPTLIDGLFREGWEKIRRL